MTTISKEEYEELKALDDKWKWIARDENTHFVNIFEEKPYKDTPIWMWRRNSYVGRIESDMSLFQFIKWEDESPYSIAELIEEYESEETEVKSKQELIEKWELAIESAEFYGKGKEGRIISYMKDFVSDLKQLDEPEVLSPDWVDKHKYRYDNVELVGVKDLQNLLVPKQEEVDRAYKDGYEKGREHGFYKGYHEGLANKGGEPETVADVVTTFWKSYERLKEVMNMEVEELEE